MKMKVKENVLPQAPLSVWWLCLATLASLITLAAVALVDYNLPEPLTKNTASNEQFIAEIAYEQLVNLTSLGPRVAGSYENEVGAVRVLVETVRQIARDASPHNRVELLVQRANGAFSLTFLDGLNNLYHGVQNVVVRVSAAGGKPLRRRTALLLNCHFDTVPDSPGGSDDAAGCAVVLGCLRAMSASRRPLRHDLVFLFNGAEENIMQGSHGFVTQHQWAKSVRAFINIEACGSGGREVLFQAGPHDPWIVEEYARSVPRPFASSLAQELFESGLIPGDTDFRIFRDFGHLSGVDLAWSANGYVYHTALDTAERAPLAALQRTGDNVLALLKGLLSNEHLESDPEPWSRQPVFFDVVGEYVVCVQSFTAAAAVVVVLGMVLLKVHLNSKAAAKQLYIKKAAWWRLVCLELAWVLAAQACGVAAALSVAVTLQATGARLTFYSRGWLLAPLYGVPALCGAWSVMGARSRRRDALLRGWWTCRLCGDAQALGCGAALSLSAALALRSGFLPLLWAAALAAADLTAHLTDATGGVRTWWWATSGLVAGTQTWYMALSWLSLFVPLTARAGAAPADVLMSVLTAVSVLAACGWMLPLVRVARGIRTMIYIGASMTAVTVLLVVLTPLGDPYSSARPQRLMVFHTRRTVHSRGNESTSDNAYWIPQLDGNTATTVKKLVPDMSLSWSEGAECSRLAYCGAPYFLPVLSFIPRGVWLHPSHATPPLPPPLTNINPQLTLRSINSTTSVLHVNVTGPCHTVVIVSCEPGVHVRWAEGTGAGSVSPQRTTAPSDRPTYFFTLFDAAPPPRAWELWLYMQRSRGLSSDGWAQISVAGHSMAGDEKLAPVHKQLLSSFPEWTATTGWGVDLHLYSV